jgi:hypothetical protein
VTKKYRVELDVNATAVVVVEAESEKEAEEKALKSSLSSLQDLEAYEISGIFEWISDEEED